MTGFFLAAGFMLLLAVAFVVLPLLRRRATLGAPSEAASNLTLLRARKREIEDDFAQGITTATERDQALLELTDRVAEELPASSASAASRVTNAPKRPWLLAVAATASLCLLAALTYGRVGNLTALNPVALQTAPDTADTTRPSQERIASLVETLAKKMEENPSDPKGWLLLARSQNALGQHAQAVQAFERALSLIPKRGAPEAAVLADYADALVMLQQGRFEGKPAVAIAEALTLDPKHQKALALAGTAEMRAGRRAASLKHWQNLKATLAAGSPDMQEVDAIIAEVSGSAPQTSPPLPENPIGARVSGTIQIAPQLRASLSKGDTLFVFARAVNGPRMPLAVLKIPVPTAWPYAFELTDAMAMTPAMKLSSFAEVLIEARVSKSGGAQAQPGDLAGQSTPVKPTSTDIAITIGTVVP